MQEILTELFWHDEIIDEKAAQLCKALPGYSKAKAEYDKTAEQIQAAVGYELYDQFFRQLMRYTNYEVRAYYSLGLGLRREMVQAFGL